MMPLLCDACCDNVVAYRDLETGELICVSCMMDRAADDRVGYERFVLLVEPASD